MRVQRWCWLVCSGVLLAMSCRTSTPPPGNDHAGAQLTAAAIAHGGVGSRAETSDGCRAAVDVALAVLATRQDPLEAVVAGVVVLEDDPRFNAGTGAIVRLDGSIQMDASVMESSGRFGAVAGIERVKNPVRVARAVLDTPHLLLMGDGATRFARSLGMPDHDASTPHRVEATAKVKTRLRTRAADLPPFWRGDLWRARWNYSVSPAALGLDEAAQTGTPTRSAPASPTSPSPGARPGDPATGSDTVGLAVRAPDGRFAVALSTGGTGIVLRGRVGDVPIYGAGLFAGAAGAAAATGTGERIIEKLLAHTVHAWLASGLSAQAAADRAVALIPRGGPTGIVVMGLSDFGAAADAKMAWAGREVAGPWFGPRPAPPSE